MSDFGFAATRPTRYFGRASPPDPFRGHPDHTQATSRLAKIAPMRKLHRAREAIRGIRPRSSGFSSANKSLIPRIESCILGYESNIQATSFIRGSSHELPRHLRMEVSMEGSHSFCWVQKGLRSKSAMITGCFLVFVVSWGRKVISCELWERKIFLRREFLMREQW